MKTDIKINVHIISAVMQAVHNMFYHVIWFKNDILFSVQYFLSLIFIDELIKLLRYFLNNMNVHFLNRNVLALWVEIDRYIGLPIFFQIFKHFTLIRYRFWKTTFFLVTYTIIQSITSSEMFSLYLTHPSAHKPGAVDTVHSGKAPARPPHVTLYKIHLFETR